MYKTTLLALLGVQLMLSGFVPAKNSDPSIVRKPIVIPIVNEVTAAWVIYPNPVRDVITLSYQGAEANKGVINIFIVQNASGRVVGRMRCASNNKVIRIPADNLGRGSYTLRVIVLNQVVSSQQFVK